MNTEIKKAAVIVSHGSRNEKAVNQFCELVKCVKEQMKDVRVEGAFFQFAQPEVMTLISQFVNEGYNDISIVPFFLMQGNHVEEDMPELVNALKKRFPKITFRISSILYPDDRLVKMVIDRISEVCS